jgi:hypothetical protein
MMQKNPSLFCMTSGQWLLFFLLLFRIDKERLSDNKTFFNRPQQNMSYNFSPEPVQASP